jgi:hypothetical protein
MKRRSLIRIIILFFPDLVEKKKRKKKAFDVPIFMTIDLGTKEGGGGGTGSGQGPPQMTIFF